LEKWKKKNLKCSKRIAIFNKKCPELPNPQRPKATTLGTCIKTVANIIEYTSRYFNDFKSVIEDFEDESQCIKLVKELFQNVSLQLNNSIFQ